MTDQENLAIVQQVSKLVKDAITADAVDALPDAVTLLAQLEAKFMPPIDAPALDSGDREAVDAEVDAEVSKT